MSAVASPGVGAAHNTDDTEPLCTCGIATEAMGRADSRTPSQQRKCFDQVTSPAAESPLTEAPATAALASQIKAPDPAALASPLEAPDLALAIEVGAQSWHASAW